MVRSKALRVGRDGAVSVRLRCPRKLRIACKGSLAVRVDRKGSRFGARTRYRIRPLPVDVALRLKRGPRGCRWWRRPLGRLSSAPARCGRPVWMKAGVDVSGRWRLDLRGRPRPGTYAVLTRARTVAARPRVIARAISGVRIR